MSRQFVILLTIGISIVSPALAHQGHQHQYLGTVERARACHFVIRTTEGESKTIFLSPSTRFETGTKSDLATGKRVSVYVENDGETAATIKVGGAQ